MSSFRIPPQKTQIICLLTRRIERFGVQFFAKETYQNYDRIINSLTTRPGIVLVFKIKNKQQTLYKKIESKNNLRQDVRNILSFHTNILPILLKDPKTKFIIQNVNRL
jgi:hypothetical protein